MKRVKTLIALLTTTVLVEVMTLVVIETRPPATPPSTVTAFRPAPSADTMQVTLYFHRVTSDPAVVVPVRRTVPKSDAVVEATLNALMSGPTSTEIAAGRWSVFVPATARTLKSVRVTGGVARVDFLDFSAVIPEAGSVFGRTVLLAELDTTLKQFPGVKSTVYSFNGDVAAFYRWLGFEPPAASGEVP